VEGLYLAFGLGGRSLLLAPAAGQATAELVIDGKTSALDVAPLRLGRFGDSEKSNGLAYTAAE
jgi:glycine/D-amino acid oxidase-like deaminating enzyme